jgi:hypothetical protein
MLPAGKRRELDGHLLGVAEAVEILTRRRAAYSRLRLKPVAGQGLAVEDGSTRVASRSDVAWRFSMGSAFEERIRDLYAADDLAMGQVLGPKPYRP